MMQKLELTWIGKGEQINPEPRILIEKLEHAYGAGDNMLIHGDNLLALKALELEYAGKVKCVYIDPPYNTGSAFEHYDDNLEHSTWLSLMKPRIELLRRLLSEDGSIWISIDDEEYAYLKVLCDEVFGRSNFVATVTWHRNYASTNDSKTFAKVVDYILVYRKTTSFQRNLLPRTEKQNSLYKYDSNDGMGRWRSDNLSVRTYSAAYDYPITNPKTGVSYNPPQGRCWMTSKERVEQWITDGRIFFGQKGDGAPQLKRYLNEVQGGVVPITYWSYEDCGHNDESRKESKALFEKDPFATPKPERLIERILTLATNEGDLVLDSFLGSGTTAAVAHKMNRRWIGIELGDHAYTHCIPRMKAVVDGEQGGISKAVNWQGGGGFKVYELAPTLLEKSKRGNLMISDKYNEDMLAAAMAKHEGYTYAPVSDPFWKQGFSGERNYIFTTTGYISPKYLDNIATGLGADEYLLICAESFDMACVKRHKNITVRPIPRMLLGRCEWGKDNYDLNVIMQEVTDWEDECDDE